MSAVEALKAARASGIQLRLDGDDLVLEGSAPPPAAILDLLSRHKPGVVALLRTSRPDRAASDWQVFFDERAGIAEFDGGLPREEAEARAIACCVVEWLNGIRGPPRRDAAPTAAGRSHPALSFCHSGLSPERTYGSTPNAGPHGIRRGRPRPLRRWRQWESTRTG